MPNADIDDGMAEVKAEEEKEAAVDVEVEVDVCGSRGGRKGGGDGSDWWRRSRIHGFRGNGENLRRCNAVEWPAINTK